MKNEQTNLLPLLKSSTTQTEIQQFLSNPPSPEGSVLFLLNLIAKNQQRNAIGLVKQMGPSLAILRSFSSSLSRSDSSSSDIVNSTIIKSLEIYERTLSQNQPKLKSTLLVTLIAAIQNVHEDCLIWLTQETILKFLQDQASYPILGALINCDAKILIKCSFILECGRKSTKFNGSIIAKIIHKEGLSLRIFASVVAYFKEKEIRRTFKYVSLCDKLGINTEDAEKFLRVLSEAPHFSFDLNYLELTINSNQFGLTYFLGQQHRRIVKVLLASVSQDERQQFWQSVRESLADGLYLEVKLWLLREFSSYATSSFVRALCFNNGAFSLSRNPLKTCLLSWEVLEIFRKNFSVQSSLIAEKQTQILDLVNEFMEEVETEEHMQRLLHDRDLTGRSVYTLIKGHPILLFKIESVIEAEWQGPIPVWRSNSLQLSTLYSASKDDPTQLLRLRAYFWRRFHSVVSPLQFQNFRRSSLLKFGYHLTFTLLLALTMQLMTVSLLYDMRAVYTHSGDVVPSRILYQAERAIKLMDIFTFLCQPLTLFFSIQILLDAKFKKLSGRSFPLLTFQNSIHFSILIANILILSQFNTDFLKSCENRIEYYNLIRNSPYSSYQSYVYAILGACMWIKVLYLMRLNRVIGPLLKILSRMAQDIFNFMALLALILLTFSCIGMILFSIPEFMTFEGSLITLFSWMLGDFSFDTMQTEGVLGYLFLAIYLLINMIVLLNLIIAILSSTYSQLETHGIGLYLKSLIDIQDCWDYHPRYNVFTFRIPPFTLLTFCFSICIKRASTDCIRVIEMVLYIPAFLLGLTFFIILDFLSLPFACFNTLRHLAAKKKAGWIVLYLFFFPIYGLSLLCLDLVLISVKLWSPPPLKTRFSRECCIQAPLMKTDLNLIEKYLQKYYKGYNGAIALSGFVRRIRDQLPFTCNYFDFAQMVAPYQVLTNDRSVTPAQNASFIKSKRAQEYSLIQDQFNNLSYCSIPNQESTESKRRESVSVERFLSVKQFLASNSFVGQNGEYSLYPGLLLEALVEVKAMERIEEKKQRVKIDIKNETKVSPLLKESLDLKSFFKSKIIKKSIQEKEDVSQQLKLYNLAQHLYFMYVGRFVKRENEFRLKKENPTELILEFISYQKEGKQFREKSKVQSVWKNRRKSKVRHLFTNPWEEKLGEEESQIDDDK